jgi:hypothetical protein
LRSLLDEEKMNSPVKEKPEIDLESFFTEWRWDGRKSTQQSGLWRGHRKTFPGVLFLRRKELGSSDIRCPHLSRRGEEV